MACFKLGFLNHTISIEIRCIINENAAGFIRLTMAITGAKTMETVFTTLISGFSEGLWCP